MDLSDIVSNGEEMEMVTCAQVLLNDVSIPGESEEVQKRKHRSRDSDPHKSIYCVFKTMKESPLVKEACFWKQFYLEEVSVHFKESENVWIYMLKARTNQRVSKWIKLMIKMNGFDMYKKRYNKSLPHYRAAGVLLEDYKKGVIPSPVPVSSTAEPVLEGMDTSDLEPVVAVSQALEEQVETIPCDSRSSIRTSMHVSRKSKGGSAGTQSQRETAVVSSQQRDLSALERMRRVFLLRSSVGNGDDFVDMARHFFADHPVKIAKVFLERYWIMQAHSTVIEYESRVPRGFLETIKESRDVAFGYKYISFDALTQIIPCIGDVVFNMPEVATKSLYRRIYLMRQEIARLNEYYRKLQMIQNEPEVRDLENVGLLGIVDELPETREEDLVQPEYWGNAVGIMVRTPANASTIYGMYFRYVPVLQKLMSEDSYDTMYFTNLAYDGKYKTCADAVRIMTSFSV